MSEIAFIDDAKIMSKGQVTIPKKVRNALGIDIGDRVTFIVDGKQVRIMNSAIYALERFQKQMAGRSRSRRFYFGGRCLRVDYTITQGGELLMRIMIDTDIITSSALFPHGKTAQALYKA